MLGVGVFCLYIVAVVCFLHFVNKATLKTGKKTSFLIKIEEIFKKRLFF